MASIKGHYWYKVRESKQDVDPHKPEQEIDQEQKPTYANRLTDDAVGWYKHCLLHWMHGYALQLKGQNYHLENVNWSVNNLRGQSTFKSRRKRTGKTINSSIPYHEEWLILSQLGRWDAIKRFYCTGLFYSRF